MLGHVRLFVTPWIVALQAPLSMGFSRQEYWSGLPCPSPEDLPDPGREPRSPALQADSLPSEPPGKLREKCGTHRNWSSYQRKSEMARESKHPPCCLILLKSGGKKFFSKDESRENFAKRLDGSPEPRFQGRKITHFSAL